MTKRLLIALAALALASFALTACGGDDEESSSSAESSAPTAESGGATLTVEADPGGTLAWVETDLTAEAGSDHVEMVNDSDTPHNVVIESEAGDDVAETETVTGETASTAAELEAGHLHLLLQRPRPPGGRNGRHAHGRVAASDEVGRRQIKEEWPMRPQAVSRDDAELRLPARQTKARPTLSATQHGFSLPSTSRVKRVTCWNQPPSSSSIETISAVARTRDPAGTGAGKRTLFQP